MGSHDGARLPCRQRISGAKRCQTARTRRSRAPVSLIFKAWSYRRGARRSCRPRGPLSRQQRVNLIFRHALPNVPAFPGHKKGEKNGALHDHDKPITLRIVSSGDARIPPNTQCIAGNELPRQYARQEQRRQEIARITHSPTRAGCSISIYLTLREGDRSLSSLEPWLRLHSRRAREPVTSMPCEWRVGRRVQTPMKLARIQRTCKKALRTALHSVQSCGPLEM